MHPAGMSKSPFQCQASDELTKACSLVASGEAAAPTAATLEAEAS